MGRIVSSHFFQTRPISVRKITSNASVAVDIHQTRKDISIPLIRPEILRRKDPELFDPSFTDLHLSGHKAQTIDKNISDHLPIPLSVIIP